MPVVASPSPSRHGEKSPSLKNLKAGNIIQRSASAESLKVLEQEKRAVKEARSRALGKTGIRLWYYRFQLLSGSYMLETWESAIFSRRTIVTDMTNL